MIDPVEGLDKLQAETTRTLQDMAATTDLDQRLKLSQIVQNLSQAQAVILGVVRDMMMDRELMDMEDEDPFDDDY